MNNYRIADAHCHIFPEKIADKAVASIGDFYGMPMSGGKGLPQALLASGSTIGVQKFLVCSTATTPGQVVSINSYIAGCCAQYPQLLGFATLHPDFADIPGELARVVSLGLRGIKLHNDFQRFDIDAPEAMEMYRHIETAGLPVLLHMGDARYDYSAPQRLAHLAGQFPGITFFAAHFGGYSRWAEAADCLGQPNVYYDTSSSLFALPAADAVAMIHKFGSDRFFFGTDYPMWQHKEELDRFLALPLTEQEREDILWYNFARFFSL